MKTLEQILGAKNLCGVIEAVKSIGASQLLPPNFLKSTRRVEGNTCTYFRVEGIRKTARLATYGSPSRVRNLSGVSEIPVTLMHTSESISHDVSTLVNLKNFINEEKQKLGEQEVARRTAEFKQLFMNLRSAAIFSLLSQGAIHFDAEGNLLPSSSDAAVTIDFGIPAGNLNQLDALGDGDIIDASWATAGTDIVGQIQALKQAAVQLSGYPLRHAFYGKSILGFLQANDILKLYLQNNQKYQEIIAGGEIPDGLLGLTWHPMSEAFSELESGGKFWVGDDTVIFTPEPDLSWYEFIEGSTPVPVNLERASDSVDALRQVILQYGMFSYAKITDDPVAIKQVSGDTCLPIIKVPKAVFIATVKF
jgi:hypothetical protein